MMTLAFIDKPDEIKCTMKFTMSLADWKQIRKTLCSNRAYTELQIINEIDDLVTRLEKTLYPNTGE